MFIELSKQEKNLYMFSAEDYVGDVQLIINMSLLFLLNIMSSRPISHVFHTMFERYDNYIVRVSQCHIVGHTINRQYFLNRREEEGIFYTYV